MNNILMKMLSFLILCSLCIACENKDEYEGQTTRNTDFTVNTGYVKLSEDSAKIAGVLHITANVPTVKLRWNVLPECNIDTTVTSLALMDGIGVLPIKWNRQLANGKYNIQERMFDVGVELIAGEESKYVHLVWADGIDSTVLAKTPVTTRATEASTEETILLNVSPATISMDPVVGGVTKVDFSGIDMIIVDQSRVETITNIDKAAIPLIMEKPGPLIFKQERIGKHNRPFYMYKFRSMVVQDEKDEKKGWTTKNDPRVTPIGRFIRKTSIDELPQLFNILIGDMSLVGPRPERPQFVEKFKEEIPRYMIKHQVRPGLTGWAQVNGYRGDTSIQKRIEFDLYYIENWTMGFDFKIIFLTFFKGFINRNAY